jgi:hypothetical protein
MDDISMPPNRNTVVKTSKIRLTVKILKIGVDDMQAVNACQHLTPILYLA